MPWIKLDDQWMNHPKIIKAGRDARDLWLASLTWCGQYLTDGYFPTELLPNLCVVAGVDVANCQTFASTLLEVCLWEMIDGQYHVHDYLDYNPSKEQAEATKMARTEAGKHGGDAKAANFKQNPSKTPSKTLAKSWQKSAPSPYPFPSPSQSPSQIPENSQNNLKSEDISCAPEAHKNTPTQKDNKLFDLATAIADVTGINFDANKQRLFREAKELAKANDISPGKVRADYGMGGLWYTTDWRGKKGQLPQLHQIRETWGTFVKQLENKGQMDDEQQQQLEADIDLLMGGPRRGLSRSGRETQV